MNALAKKWECFKDFVYGARGKNVTCLVCSPEQFYEQLDAPTPVDVHLVCRDLGKLSQGSHNIYQHVLRLVGQQANKGL